MHYTESGLKHHGSGATFVLLHGLGGSRQHWGEVQRELSRTSYSVAVDIPGFGRDRANWRNFTVESASDDIAAFCRARSIGAENVLVSHSIGSVVAGAVAARASDVFSKVVLISGTLFRASEITQRPAIGLRDIGVGAAVAAQFAAGMVPVGGLARRIVSQRKLLRRMAFWPFVTNPGSLDSQVVYSALENSGSVAVLKILVNARSIDYLAMLSRIPQSVDLLWGDRDRLITSGDIATAKQLLAVDRTEVVPNCGHWPMIEAARETARFIQGGEQRHDDQA